MWLPLQDKAVGHAAADQAFVIRQFDLSCWSVASHDTKQGGFSESIALPVDLVPITQCPLTE
jgi:hypothetical protein